MKKDNLAVPFVWSLLVFASACSGDSDTAISQSHPGGTGGEHGSSGGSGGAGGGSSSNGGSSNSGGATAAGGSTPSGGASSSAGGAGNSGAGGGANTGGSSSGFCGSDPCTPTRCAGIGCGPAVCCHGPNGPVCIHGASECPAPNGGVQIETLTCWSR